MSYTPLAHIYACWERAHVVESKIIGPRCSKLIHNVLAQRLFLKLKRNESDMKLMPILNSTVSKNLLIFGIFYRGITVKNTTFYDAVDDLFFFETIAWDSRRLHLRIDRIAVGWFLSWISWYLAGYLLCAHHEGIVAFDDFVVTSSTSTIKLHHAFMLYDVANQKNVRWRARGDGNGYRTRERVLYTRWKL